MLTTINVLLMACSAYAFSSVLMRDQVPVPPDKMPINEMPANDEMPASHKLAAADEMPPAWKLIGSSAMNATMARVVAQSTIIKRYASEAAEQRSVQGILNSVERNKLRNLMAGFERVLGNGWCVDGQGQEAVNRDFVRGSKEDCAKICNNVFCTAFVHRPALVWWGGTKLWDYCIIYHDVEGGLNNGRDRYRKLRPGSTCAAEGLVEIEDLGECKQAIDQLRNTLRFDERPANPNDPPVPSTRCTADPFRAVLGHDVGRVLLGPPKGLLDS